MNILKSNLVLLVLGVLSITSTIAQEKKGISYFTVYHEFDHPIATLWETVAVNYGDIINSHPAIVASTYINGSTTGALGAERKLAFNKKESKALYEKITKWDPEGFTYDVQLIEADGFPINEEVTLATLTFESLGVNKSSFQFAFSFGTKPRFMGALVKGKFASLLKDYMIALEHFLLTGEQVNATTGNFKEVKKAYKERHAYDDKSKQIASK